MTPANGRLPVGYQPREVALLGPCAAGARPCRFTSILRGNSPSSCAAHCAAKSYRSCRGSRKRSAIASNACTARRVRPGRRRRRSNSGKAPAAIWPCCGSISAGPSASRRGSSAATTKATPAANSHFLHAWGEVYLPGAGWRGFDPTNGLAVSDRHIAVAASADPQYAAPGHGHVSRQQCRSRAVRRRRRRKPIGRRAARLLNILLTCF